MRISEDSIKEVLDALDIVTVISNYVNLRQNWNFCEKVWN